MRGSLHLAALGSFAFAAGVLPVSAEVRWSHPAGIVTQETIAEVKDKLATQEWASKTYAARKQVLQRWLSATSEELKRAFPTKRGNVYHNFSCPKDRVRLTYDPLNPGPFTCPVCGRHYPPDTDAGIYSAADRYHGTVYDGWACLFYEDAGNVAADLGLMGCMEEGDVAQACFRRGIEILLLHADTIENLPTRRDPDPQFTVLLTYHREGDNKVLNDLSCAYELLRGHMTEAQRARFERSVLQRMLDDVMLEPIYTYNLNNVYQWHRTVVQTALALQRDDLIDWSFGYGPYDPAKQPEHRSIRRLAATHFKPDGAYWEMCSGYHLYPLHYFCELAVVSHNLAKMDPVRFPANSYDLTDRSSAGGKVIHAGLEWFMSMAMPDRTMPTIGDSMASRAGMDDYFSTAEVGYRFFGIQAVGDYKAFREGGRSWAALLYGAPEIRRHRTPYTSSYLSSGWVSLRNQWQGNQAWVGLNALIPGGGHQHADRLTLLTYSHGKLLALEKGTPYNEGVTRNLGTLSQSHNTVTVDQTSQPQGETLKGDQIPKVAHFFAGPVAQFAELHADRLYPNTDRYRRSVALIEDVAVDCFRVRGGKTHDWIIHHAGSAPTFSVTMEKGGFAPADWLANGTDRVLHARIGNQWDAAWKVDGVTSRLTMAAADGTDVYALETYPLDNAVITPQNPPCQTLVVRRASDAPFLAVWDSWRGSPNVKSVSRPDGADALLLATAANTYHLLFGPGKAHFADDLTIESDAVFALWRNRDAAMAVGGTMLEIQSPQGRLRIATDKPAAVCAEWTDTTVTLETAGDIHYDTVAGRDRYRPVPAVNVTFDGPLWTIRETRRRTHAGTE